MKHTFRLCFFSIVVLTLTSFAFAQVHQHAFVWSQATGMVDLGTLGGTDSLAAGINDSGVVVGAAYSAGSTIFHAFRWAHSTGMRPLPDFGFGSYAFAISNSGKMTGFALLSTGIAHAVEWSNDGTIQDLGTLGGDSSEGRAVNDNGDVAGDSYTPSPFATDDAFFWTSAGGMQDIATKGFVNGINNVQSVVGQYILGRYYHAFFWTAAGGFHDLGTLGGHESIAQAINATGQVVGSSSLSTGESHAMFWSAPHGMRDLGTLGGTFSYAWGINANGVVAGQAQAPGDTAVRAVIWSHGGITDLGTLGGVNSYGEGINSTGQVAGFSEIP